MASINDITGQEIKTKPQTSKYAEGWDRIFAKKTAYEWLSSMPGVVVYDPDGWRMNDGVTMETPIKWSDFQYRLNMSTCMGLINLVKK